MSEIREQLAGLEHEQWVGWMNYLFEKSIEREDGSVTIPAELVERWKRQINTPYANLSDSEKESDREIADKVLRIIKISKHFE